MNNDPFFKMCKDRSTHVAILDCGHNQFYQPSPAKGFVEELDQARQEQRLGDGKVFFTPGASTMGQLSYALEYIIHAASERHYNIKPVIVGNPKKVEECLEYLDALIKTLDRFNSFEDLVAVSKHLEELIRISLNLYLTPIEVKMNLSQEENEKILFERIEFQEKTLDEILVGTHIGADINDSKVKQMRRRRDELSKELTHHLLKLNPQLSVGTYMTLCNSIDEILKVSRHGWGLDRYKALLASMKKHIYSFANKENALEAMSNGTSIYSGGGQPWHAVRNIKGLGGIAQLSRITKDYRIPWHGYSLGMVLALDKMIALAPDETHIEGNTLYVDSCSFRFSSKNDQDNQIDPDNEGLGLVQGEMYLPGNAFDRLVVPQMRDERLKDKLVIVYFNSASLVKATNDGNVEYRVFIDPVDTRSCLQVYSNGNLVQQFNN